MKTNIKKATLISSLLTLCVISLPAFSGNWSFLKNSPVESFDDDDWSLLKKTAREALENGENGIAVTWVNQKTGHSGTITPLTTKDHNGSTCRKTKFFNSANEMTGSAVFYLCKQDDETWKVVN
jgi:surface antigen